MAANHFFEEKYTNCIARAKLRPVRSNGSSASYVETVSTIVKEYESVMKTKNQRRQVGGLTARPLERQVDTDEQRCWMLAWQISQTTWSATPIVRHVFPHVVSLMELQALVKKKPWLGTWTLACRQTILTLYQLGNGICRF